MRTGERAAKQLVEVIFRVFGEKIASRGIKRNESTGLEVGECSFLDHQPVTEVPVLFPLRIVAFFATAHRLFAWIMPAVERKFSRWQGSWEGRFASVAYRRRKEGVTRGSLIERDV